MDQRIEAPNPEDLESLAHQVVHAGELAKDLTGRPLTGQLTDLDLLQRVLDSGRVEPEATYSLQALGTAFGRVFIGDNPHYDWWMVEDDYGRDPSVQYKDTSLRIFPQTMISKRIEDGEEFRVRQLYEDLLEELEKIRREDFPDA